MAYPKKIPHGIMFHHFYNEAHPRGQGAISADDLDNILRYVGIERILPPLEWLKRLKESKLKDGDVCLTFDDALLCQTEIALPVLEKYGLRAFWFVYSGVFEGRLENLELYRFFRVKHFDNIDDFYQLFLKKVSDLGMTVQVNSEFEKKMLADFPFYSVNDVRFRFLRDKVLGKEDYEKIMNTMLKDYGLDKKEMSKSLWMSNRNLKYLSDNGHIVGLHSYSHPTSFADLPFKAQLDEYKKNYSHIKRVTGQNPVAVAHPVNSYNADTLKILEELGIICGFRSNMFPKTKMGALNANAFEMAREDHANIARMMET
ncbi:MAG: polysaccharide deacetylase family protein [Candidatus Giovannonibacteria bacterium]|nr:MAG: polysaccharide deacetylase family protein [Candidatus Giovannonibacteria bacterium]